MSAATTGPDTEPAISTAPPEPASTPTQTRQRITWSDSYSKAQNAIQNLSSILPSVPASLTSSETPAFSLLHDAQVSDQISKLLRQPGSGAGDNNLCRWLYDTFQSSEPDLHLVVLRFLPIIAGVYLSRVTLHKPLAGFEAVLLALYAHETSARNGQALTVSIPDLSHSSIYHETNAKKTATELNIAVISPSLEPHGTVRSTRRARIVGVALELYYNKISQMPVESKVEFCHFCKLWAGRGDPNSVEDKAGGGGEEEVGRVLLPWELLQPVLRILGHCLMGPNKNQELFDAAYDACRRLYTRALHDLNPKAILATESLLKLAKMALESKDEIDYTDITDTNVISL